MMDNMDVLDVLLAIASDLTSALSATDRYRRLLEAVRRAIPYDAAALLRLEGSELVPVAAVGLDASALGRRFSRREHPRLELIASAEGPLRFPPSSPLPDPFDDLLAGHPPSQPGQRIHACLGCPLRVGGELVGALTADAIEPAAFDPLDQRFLAAVGALAAAELRATSLIEALERAASRQGLVARDLMRDTQLRQGSQLLGVSPLIQRLREEIALVARSDLAVLVTGETGVGKELVARAIHALSDRRDEPLLYVNCAALPEALADSELFGHRRGAFTGATSDRPGKFEVADGGTLFLDEIGELPLAIQPKLLRALQQGEIQRVGTDRPLQVNVRVLAATNRDLELEVREGRFRADLYHRLNVYPLRTPPLRERREDIPLLAGFFSDMARRRLGTGPVRLEGLALEQLAAHDWPGNVRELENVISRAVLKASAEVRKGTPVVVEARHLGGELAAEAPPAVVSTHLHETVSLRTATARYQRELIERAVAASGGNWAEAARQLGLHRSNLHHLAARLGLR